MSLWVLMRLCGCFPGTEAAGVLLFRCCGCWGAVFRVSSSSVASSSRGLGRGHEAGPFFAVFLVLPRILLDGAGDVIAAVELQPEPVFAGVCELQGAHLIKVLTGGELILGAWSQAIAAEIVTEEASLSIGGVGTLFFGGVWASLGGREGDDLHGNVWQRASPCVINAPDNGRWLAAEALCCEAEEESGPCEHHERARRRLLPAVASCKLKIHRRAPSYPDCERWKLRSALL